MAHVAGKYAAIFRMKEGIGQPVNVVAGPIGTGDGANKTFVLGHLIHACDAIADWNGTVLVLDPADKKEGTNSIQDVDAGGSSSTYYTPPAAALDLTHHRYISLWFKCTLASAAMVTTRVRIYTAPDFNYYNISFPANTWVRLDIPVRSPDGTGGIPASLDQVTSIEVVLDSGGPAFVLHIDWLTRNPVATEAITIKDAAVAVPYEDVSVSPSGIVVFDTAPVGVNAITADYDYYEEIEQIGGAYDWEANMTVDTPEVTDFQSASGAKEFIVGNEGWTGTSSRHYELSDEMTSGQEYIIRMYLYLDKDLPEYYEGWAKLNRISKTVPQEEVVDEALEFQGSGRFFKVFQT